MNQQELSHTLRKEIIKQGRSVQIFASGYSMYPFLRKGDLLTVEPVSMETIKRGDVVVFESEEKWIAHRVISISHVQNQILLKLKGDTNLIWDQQVNISNYIGIVIKLQRKKNDYQLSRKTFTIWKWIILASFGTYQIGWHFIKTIWALRK